MQLDDNDEEGPSSKKPPLGSRSPLPRRQKNAPPRPPPSSTLLLLPGRAAAARVPQQQAEAGSHHHGRVRFDSVVQLILVPSRRDMSADLSQELWWNQEDYLQFRCDIFYTLLLLSWWRGAATSFVY